MSSTSPSVWPSPDATPTPPPSPTPTSNPAPRAAGRAAAGTLVAVALVGVLIGAGVDRVASTARMPGSLLPASILTSLPHTTTSSSSTTSTTAPSQSAPAANAAPAQSNPAPAQGSNPAAGQGGNPAPAASTDPAQQAVQQVIQKGDTEQAQAVSSKDLSVMSDTSTPDFLTQQQQATQDLLNNGVTSIDLSNIEWGPITVNGNTATAINYETWTTTYSDGTTEQSRDRNDYTLVQQNGTWLVQSDVHPDDAAAAGAPGVAGQVPGGSNPFPFPGRGQGGSGSNPFANPGGANGSGSGAGHANHGQGGNGGQPAGSGTNA